MLSAAQDSLLTSLRWLQDSEEYSDLRIFCGDQVFKVHKAIVCARSPYFATSCKWGKDGESKEEITLEDDDSKLIRLMIDYLYRLDYDDVLSSPVAAEPTDMAPQKSETPAAEILRDSECFGQETLSGETLAAATMTDPDFLVDRVFEHPTETSKEDCWGSLGSRKAKLVKKDKKDKKKRKPEVVVRPRLRDCGTDLDADRLTVNTLMYALADKYAIEDLKMLAKTKFDQAAEEDWESQAFVHAAKLVFETTPGFDKGLRSTVVNVLNGHRELMNYGDVQDLLDSGNGIAWALVQILVGG